jgi:predicted site-specific integrase-resolvase
MKLSAYAKKLGISYKTAWRWYSDGRLDAYQTETGTIIVREQSTAPLGVALYARVSSADQKGDLERQVERLQTYAIARGYKVDKVVAEHASGLNDTRPKLTALLKDSSIGVIVVEHRERLTRFGYNYIVTLLEMQGRRVEVVFPQETDDSANRRDDLVEDFIAVITSMCARLYGRRGNKNRSERLRQCIEQVAQDESVQD